MFIASFVMLRRGIALEKIYNSSKYAKAPKFPLKTVAGSLLAISSSISAYLGDYSFIQSLMLGIAVILGWYLYYGFDPRADKLNNLPAGVDAEDLIEVTQNAHQKIKKLKLLKRELKSFESKEHLQSIIMETQEIIASIEKNPSDLSRARKFFKIYLARTENITNEFVENLHNGNIDDTMTKNYNTLLKSVKHTIKEQKEKLNDDDILRLDVQIEALTKQINHEGV